MEFIEFESLPRRMQEKVKKMIDKETSELYRSMGMALTRHHLKVRQSDELEKMFFIKSAGDVYQYFKPELI